jgi:hypothetical protein
MPELPLRALEARWWGLLSSLNWIMVSRHTSTDYTPPHCSDVAVLAWEPMYLGTHAASKPMYVWKSIWLGSHLQGNLTSNMLTRSPCLHKNQYWLGTHLQGNGEPMTKESHACLDPMGTPYWHRNHLQKKARNPMLARSPREPILARNPFAREPMLTWKPCSWEYVDIHGNPCKSTG